MQQQLALPAVCSVTRCWDACAWRGKWVINDLVTAYYQILVFLYVLGNRTQRAPRDVGTVAIYQGIQGFQFRVFSLLCNAKLDNSMIRSRAKF